MIVMVVILSKIKWKKKEILREYIDHSTKVVIEVCGSNNL